jgi:TadE-like protein
MTSPYFRLKREASGQAAIETALMLPFLLGLVFNVVNFGYFFLVAINLTAAPRSGVEYSILGFQTPNSLSLPPPGQSSACTTTTSLSVSCLTLNDLTGAISGGGSTKVQVCTAQAGTSGSGAAQISVCSQYNGFSSKTPDADPEAPLFILNRVDVAYTFKPLLDQRLFNLVLLASPVCTGSGSGVNCTFHRQVSMRAMN